LSEVTLLLVIYQLTPIFWGSSWPFRALTLTLFASIPTWEVTAMNQDSMDFDPNRVNANLFLSNSGWKTGVGTEWGRIDMD